MVVRTEEWRRKETQEGRSNERRGIKKKQNKKNDREERKEMTRLDKKSKQGARWKQGSSVHTQDVHLGLN